MFDREGHAAGVVARGRRLRRAMTWPEQRLWKELRKLDAHMRRQAPIGRFVVDFACHSRRVVVEVDGPVHREFADVAVRDAERQQWLEAQGYRVLRFTDKQVGDDVWACVDKVRRALALPLDGGGLGGGAGSAPLKEARLGAGAQGELITSFVPTPPSPALPPSRGKGD